MLTDDELIVHFKASCDSATADVTVPPGWAQSARRGALRRRRRTAAAASSVLLAAGVVGTAVLVDRANDSPVPSHHAHPVRLAGYHLQLPASYGALSGTCTLELPDDTSVEGVPGLGGSCAAGWLAAQVPAWLQPALQPTSVPSDGGAGGSQRVDVETADQDGLISIVPTNPDPSGRYFILSVRLGGNDGQLTIADLMQVMATPVLLVPEPSPS